MGTRTCACQAPTSLEVWTALIVLPTARLSATQSGRWFAKGLFDANGCRMPETCEPAMNGELPNFCPVYCPPDGMHKFCPGPTNLEIGLQEPGWCMLCWSGLDSPTCKCEPDSSVGTGPSG